jgi:hypothetical protein
MVHNVESKEITPKFIERVKDLITSEVLGADLKFVLAKKVINANNKYNVLMLEDSVIDVILE